MSPADLEWLEAHTAILSFRDGNPLRIEFRRTRDGLWVGAQADTLDTLMADARKLDLRGERS